METTTEVSAKHFVAALKAVQKVIRKSDGEDYAVLVSYETDDDVLAVGVSTLVAAMAIEVPVTDPGPGFRARIEGDAAKDWAKELAPLAKSAGVCLTQVSDLIALDHIGCSAESCERSAWDLEECDPSLTSTDIDPTVLGRVVTAMGSVAKSVVIHLPETEGYVVRLEGPVPGPDGCLVRGAVAVRTRR